MFFVLSAQHHFQIYICNKNLDQKKWGFSLDCWLITDQLNFEMECILTFYFDHFDVLGVREVLKKRFYLVQLTQMCVCGVG